MEIKIGFTNPTIIKPSGPFPYYKNILYREPATGQFPIIYYMFEQELTHRFDTKKYLVVKIVGFEKSLLEDNDDQQTHLDCKFHEILEYYPDEEYTYRKMENTASYYVYTTCVGKGKINLNEEINEIESLKVVKIIIALEQYIIKPRIDCILTRDEELYYKHLSFNEPNPFEGIENPYDNQKWTALDDHKYWEKYEKENGFYSVHNNQTTPKNTIELWIGTEQSTIILNRNTFDDFFYKKDVCRDPETNQFPTFRYKFKCFQRFRNHKRSRYSFNIELICNGQFLYNREENISQYRKEEGEILPGEILLNDILDVSNLNIKKITIFLRAKRLRLDIFGKREIVIRKCVICEKYCDMRIFSEKVRVLECRRTAHIIMGGHELEDDPPTISNHEEHVCHELCIQKYYPGFLTCLYCLFEKDECCSICLENITSFNEQKKLLCNHLFHKNCINNWLANHNSCPNCRFEV